MRKVTFFTSNEDEGSKLKIAGIYDLSTTERHLIVA